MRIALIGVFAYTKKCIRENDQVIAKVMMVRLAAPDIEVP
jgi:hypothetical protein